MGQRWRELGYWMWKDSRSKNYVKQQRLRYKFRKIVRYQLAMSRRTI